MKKYYIGKQIYCLLFFFLFIASSNGQNTSHLTKVSVSEQKTNPIGLPKIIKTQGTNQYTNVHCGLQDKAGNLWFGTTGEGVYRYDGKSFTNFTVKDGLISNTIWSILEDKSGNIWFGTGDGICLYGPSSAHKTSTKTFTSVPITLTNRNYFYSTNPANNNMPQKNAVWSILQDKSGKFWFGTNEGVYCYNGKFFTSFLENSGVINNGGLQLKMVDCIFEDKAGNIWFGSGMPPGMEGVARYDGKSITGFKPNGDGWIRTILEDKNGTLCFATRHQGVCRYDGKTAANFTEKAGIINDSVSAIFKDKAGNIWVGTENGSGEIGEDGGLWRFDGKSFTKFTTKDGLCHNGVFCILEDKTGNIWVGTRNTGLCRYDGKAFTNFTE